jgi:hypothetical protein
MSVEIRLYGIIWLSAALVLMLGTIFGWDGTGAALVFLIGIPILAADQTLNARRLNIEQSMEANRQRLAAREASTTLKRHVEHRRFSSVRESQTLRQRGPSYAARIGESAVLRVRLSPKYNGPNGLWNSFGQRESLLDSITTRLVTKVQIPLSLSLGERPNVFSRTQKHKDGIFVIIFESMGS